jgi:hypothetical protein
MTATDITVTLARPTDDCAWNWAEAATAQWIAAAEEAGLTVELVSEEVQHVDSEAAIVSVNDTHYVLDVHGDTVRAIPADDA